MVCYVMTDEIKIDYISWLYYMGLYETANIWSEGEWTMTWEGGVSCVSKETIEKVTQMIYEEIENTRND